MTTLADPVARAKYARDAVPARDTVVLRWPFRRRADRKPISDADLRAKFGWPEPTADELAAALAMVE